MKVFISYSSNDKQFIKILSKALGKNSIAVWLDRHQLKIGDHLSQRINQAIYEVDHVIIVISPSSLASQWVRYEMELTLKREKEEKKSIILPLLFVGSLIPPELVGRIYSDFRNKDTMERDFARILQALGISQQLKREKVKHEVIANFIGLFLSNSTMRMSDMDYFMNCSPMGEEEAEPYVKIGQIVKPSTLLGRIGATFGSGESEILAECDGVIEKILVTNLQKVAYGEVLFVIKLSTSTSADIE